MKTNKPKTIKRQPGKIRWYVFAGSCPRLQRLRPGPKYSQYSNTTPFSAGPMPCTGGQLLCEMEFIILNEIENAQAI